MSIEKAYIQKFMNESNAKHEANPHEKEWEEYRTGVKGSFMKYLALAFQQADTKNIVKLQSAFPEVGKIFALWKTNGTQDHFESAQKNESKSNSEIQSSAEKISQSSAEAKYGEYYLEENFMYSPELTKIAEGIGFEEDYHAPEGAYQYYDSKTGIGFAFSVCKNKSKDGNMLFNMSWDGLEGIVGEFFAEAKSLKEGAKIIKQKRDEILNKVNKENKYKSTSKEPKSEAMIEDEAVKTSVIPSEISTSMQFDGRYCSLKLGLKSLGINSLVKDLLRSYSTQEQVKYEENTLKEVTSYIEQCAKEFDSKVISKLEELGFYGNYDYYEESSQRKSKILNSKSEGENPTHYKRYTLTYTDKTVIEVEDGGDGKFYPITPKSRMFGDFQYRKYNSYEDALKSAKTELFMKGHDVVDVEEEDIPYEEYN